jgi:hypothetical protein
MSDPSEGNVIRYPDKEAMRRSQAAGEELMHRSMIAGVRFGLALGLIIAALLSLMVRCASAAEGPGTCLALQECKDLHAGYCRHHAGCWHAGAHRSRMPAATPASAPAPASTPVPAPRAKPFDENPHGDPIWSEIDVDPYGDPIWLEMAPNDRVADAFGAVRRSP